MNLLNIEVRVLIRLYVEHFPVLTEIRRVARVHFCESVFFFFVLRETKKSEKKNFVYTLFFFLVLPVTRAW